MFINQELKDSELNNIKPSVTCENKNHEGDNENIQLKYGKNKFTQKCSDYFQKRKVAPAMNSNKGTSSLKIFVGGVPPLMSNVELESLFKSESTKNIELKNNLRIMSSCCFKGYGFINVSGVNKEILDECLLKMNLVYNGRKFILRTAIDRSVAKETKLKKKDNKLLVRNLTMDITHVELYQYFSQFGKIDNTYAAFDPKTNLHKGFGFVMFENFKDVKTVMNIKNHKIKDTVVHVCVNYLKGEMSPASNEDLQKEASSANKKNNEKAVYFLSTASNSSQNSMNVSPKVNQICQTNLGTSNDLTKYGTSYQDPNVYDSMSRNEFYNYDNYNYQNELEQQKIDQYCPEQSYYYPPSQYSQPDHNQYHASYNTQPVYNNSFSTYVHTEVYNNYYPENCYDDTLYPQYKNFCYPNYNDQTNNYPQEIQNNGYPQENYTAFNNYNSEQFNYYPNEVNNFSEYQLNETYAEQNKEEKGYDNLNKLQNILKTRENSSEENYCGNEPKITDLATKTSKSL